MNVQQLIEHLQKLVAEDPTVANLPVFYRGCEEYEDDDSNWRCQPTREFVNGATIEGSPEFENRFVQIY